MSNNATIAELFDLAIAAEQACEALYHGLADRFAHHPAVADFWTAYADEEAGHARWLERLSPSSARWPASKTWKMPINWPARPRTPRPT